MELDAAATAKLTTLMSSYLTTRALQVAIRLGVGRLVSGGPRSAAEIAAETSTDPRMLDHLLQVLAAAEVLTFDDGRYGPTTLSEHLDLFDQPLTGDEAWRCATELEQAVRTGRAPFPELFGAPMFEYLAARPQANRRWNAWNSITVSAWLTALVPLLEVVPGETVVDVGGGEGALLAMILNHSPEARGVLFDLPDAVVGASGVLGAAGVADRCEVVAGDAFAEVPSGGDVYLLSRVLFNWSDADAVRLLRAVAAAMSSTSRLCVIENLVGSRLGALAPNNLRLALLFDSRHHSETDMRDLCEQAGLEVANVASTSESMFAVVTARRRE